MLVFKELEVGVEREATGAQQDLLDRKERLLAVKRGLK